MERRKKMDLRCSSNEKLSHYTSVGAAVGILESKELWFCNARSMNDKTDSQHFYEQLIAAMESDGIVLADMQSFFDRIKERLLEEMPYIFCLSRNYDDAAQWERYGDRAQGICIVFKPSAIWEVFPFFASMVNEVFYKYDVRENELFNITANYIQNNRIEGFKDESALIDNIIISSFIRKHPGFESEREVRICSLGSKPIHEALIERKVVNGNIIKDVMVVPIGKMCESKGVDFESFIEEIIAEMTPIADKTKNDFQFKLIIILI